MEFRVINIDEIIDETTLIEAINDNIKTASFHREQIKRMKQATKPKKVIITPTLEQPKLKEEKRIMLFLSEKVVVVILLLLMVLLI